MGITKRNKTPKKRSSRKKIKNNKKSSANKKGGFLSSFFSGKSEDEVDNEANQIITEEYESAGGDINSLFDSLKGGEDDSKENKENEENKEGEDDKPEENKEGESNSDDDESDDDSESDSGSDDDSESDSDDESDSDNGNKIVFELHIDNLSLNLSGESNKTGKIELSPGSAQELLGQMVDMINKRSRSSNKEESKPSSGGTRKNRRK